MKKAKLEKSPWVKVKKKPRPKKVKKSFDEAKQLQLARATRDLGTTSQIFFQTHPCRKISGQAG